MKPVLGFPTQKRTLMSLYYNTKYPVYSALPQSLPDPAICRDALSIANKVKKLTTGILKINQKATPKG